MTGYKRDPLQNIPSQDALSYIPNPSTPKSREYERKRPARSYRLTDKEIGPHISAIAYKEGLTVDETARAFVEAALQHINEIPFDNVPIHERRKSLYPVDGSHPKVVFQVREDGWPVTPPPQRPARPKTHLSTEERKRKQRELNLFIVRYRWTAEVDAAIQAVAAHKFGEPTGRSDGRKGWVLTILLRYALARYYAGRWIFRTGPEAVVRMSAELVEQ